MKLDDHAPGSALPKTLVPLVPPVPVPRRAVRDAAGLALRSTARWLGAMSRETWHALTLDDRAAHLVGAVDLADLERRMRIWNHADRRPW